MGTKERVEILNKSNCVTNELLKRISNLEYEVERLNNIISKYDDFIREYLEFDGYSVEWIERKIKELKGEDK